MGSTTQQDARRILNQAYGITTPQAVSLLAQGNINVTYRVEPEAGTTVSAGYVLQKLHPIFPVTIHPGIDAVTKHIANQGLITPALVPTQSGELAYQDPADGSVWRLMTFIDGVTHQRATSPEQCRQAGKLLAQFHQAASTVHHDFPKTKLNPHDLQANAHKLQQALEDHPKHIHYNAVSELANHVLSAAPALPRIPAVPSCIVHGDPKIANFIFTPEGTARALVDLDTIGPRPLLNELGDALRSWCNPGGESAPQGQFEPAFFNAALQGYSETLRQAPHNQPQLTQETAQAIPAATETIALCLAMRFAADALNESYFAWDEQNFPSATAHHLRRAQNQWQLAQAIRQQSNALQTSIQQLEI